MKIALLSNVTADVLAGMLSKEHSVWIPSGFGAWMETALEPPQGLLDFRPDAVFLLLDGSHATYSADDAAAARCALGKALPAANVILPDLGDLADESGGGFFDERMWQAASMPWSMKGLRAICGEIGRLLALAKCGRRKAIAVDFDNTLWKGVIGEDGVDGIAPFTEFQRGLKALAARGVLLAGLSKNGMADVEPAWSDPRMVLAKEDFSAMRVDWNDKAANLVSVANELNIGTDGFVFLDDNPAERERMKAALPEVAVPDWPAGERDPARLLRRVARTYFPEMRVTGDDLRRTARYREDAARRDFAAGRSLDDYLAGLEIWVDVHPAAEDELQRIAQLSQKTNQFNMQTHRYTAEELAAFAHDPGRALFAARAGDRFGDAGTVAFVKAEICAGGVARISDFAMSCRVMNRRIEYAIEERVEEELAARGARVVRARWERTAKNAPAENVYGDFGFTLVSSGDGFKEYELRLPRKTRLRHSATFRSIA